MKKLVSYSILFLLFSVIPIFSVSAGRGCCSHHGGQAYCSNGRWVCNDGTFSPTCTCSGGNSSGSYKNYYNTTTKSTTTKRIYGCTDRNAINYNLNASISDGSCNYEKTEIVNENIYYDTETKGTLTSGKKEVIREGKNGKKEVTIKKIVDENGNTISTERLNETIIVEPVSEIIEYHATTKETKKESNNTPIIVTIILLLLNVFYSYKNKDANLIINKIKSANYWIKYILYFLYFIFVIPVFIDIILVIIDLFKKNKQS